MIDYQIYFTNCDSCYSKWDSVRIAEKELVVNGKYKNIDKKSSLECLKELDARIYEIAKLNRKNCFTWHYNDYDSLSLCSECLTKITEDVKNAVM